MAQPQADAAVVAAAAAAYQRQVQQQRAALAAFITRLWQSLGTYRNAQMATFAQQAVPVVGGAQQNIAALTAAYLARHRQLHVGGPGRPVPVDVRRLTGAAVRNGTSPTQVYERPFHLVWRQLGEGTPPADAIQSGLDRAVQSALTDLQLTKVRTAHTVLAGDKAVAGYRRVLEGAHSCGLCVLASTQRYHRGDLLPVHPGCDCNVEPILGDTDPGQVIDEPRLRAAYEALAGQPPKDMNAARWTDHVVIVHDHGELGPVLARKGASFLGPGDL